MRPLRIAHIVSTYPPYYGGMGNVVFETASSLNQRGHEVVVYTPEYEREGMSLEDKESFSEREDFASRLKPRLAYGNAAYLPDLKKELDSCDVVHLHYPFFGTAYLVARWKKRNPHKPLVITYHMDARDTGFKGLLFRWYAWYYLPRILSRADTLVSASFDYISSSDAALVYKAQPDRWVEIPFGVDTERFSPRPKPSELFGAHSLDPALYTVVFVGGMDSAHYFKGVPVLLQALKLCIDSGVRIQAVCVGEGNLRQKFIYMSRGMGIASSIAFVGSVSHDMLPEYYAMGDVCVLPSVSRGEAFGMVLIEAFASGVPVIASDLAGVRTVASQAGDVVIPGDPESLAQALIARVELGESEILQSRVQARAIAEKVYGWEHVIDKLESVYSQVIEKNSQNSV